MKAAITTILLTLLMSMGAWGAEKKESTLCKGELGKKPEYKEYCAEYSKLPSESLLCKGSLGKKKEYKDYCSQFKKSDSNFKSKSKSKPTDKRLTIKDLKTLDKKWKNYSGSKAIAVGGRDDNPSVYMCYGYQSLSSAMRCALNGCQSRGVACAIAVENNSAVDEEVIEANLAIAKRNFSGGNSSNYSSGSQSQQKSTTDKCLEKMEEARDKFENGCAFTEKSYGSGLLDALAILSKCEQKAEAQFPDAACYGTGLPPRLPPASDKGRQGNTGWKYVLTLDNAASLCPITATKWLYSLNHQEVSGMNRICYYK
jgi:hypothetical protein